MTNSAVLVDVTRCVGCGSCTVACKLWNDLAYEPGEEGNAHGYNVKLGEQTWTTVGYYETKNTEGEDVLRFAKHQCMHCLEPACVSVCFADAITVADSGAVVYDPKKCVGCRYCLIACPYDVPKYEWDTVFPSVMKCQLCENKLVGGEGTSCSTVCPSGALTFGDRDELLAQAKKTIASDSRYVNKIYGEHEAGGARWLYISDVPFEELGFTNNVPQAAVKANLEQYTRLKPGVFIGALAVFGGISIYTKRRLKVEKESSGGSE